MDVSPDLHALAPGAHIFAQQQVVECDGTDNVELLLNNLLNELRVVAMATHDAVEGVQLADDGVECEGSLISYAGRSFTQTCGLHT